MGIIPPFRDRVRDWRDTLASHRAFACRHVARPQEISAMNRSGIRIVRLLAFAGLTLLSARADAGMMLTAAGVAQGFALSTFATDFPNSGMNGYGPIGIAFPVSGGVLVSDLWDGTLNHFPTDTDNQSNSDAGVTHQRSFNSPLGYYY